LEEISKVIGNSKTCQTTEHFSLSDVIRRQREKLTI
jgi:hypothetical protein